MVSYEAATVLVRVPPFFLLAHKYKRIYDRVKDMRELEDLAFFSYADIYEIADSLMIRQWKTYLQNSQLPGVQMCEMISPVFEQWLIRRHGEFNHFVSQLLTRYSSFGVFLYKIRKVPMSPL